MNEELGNIVVAVLDGQQKLRAQVLFVKAFGKPDRGWVDHERDTKAYDLRN
jgi:hypothetical protein